MSTSSSCRSGLLRRAFFALLVLGVMARPMAMEFCEALTVDHQSAAHAHKHHHEHAHDPGEDTRGEDWHAHGEQARADSGGGAIDMVRPFLFEPVRLGSARVPTLRIASAPSARVPGPFRPPIG